jgi:hypothetical protein
LVEGARETFSDLELEEVDITRRPEVAIKYRVMAGVPERATGGCAAGAAARRRRAREGRWDLTLRVKRQGKPFELSLTEQVSR